MEQQQQQEAETYVRAQFISKSLFPEFIVSQNSMLKILDAMSHQSFDRELAKELFNQCRVSFKGDIQIENFIQVLLEASKILNTKFKKSIKTIQEYSQQRVDCIYQLKQAEKNQESVMVPKLIITVIEASHLYQGETNITQKPYVVLYCGSEKQSTNLAQNDKFNPRFLQTFTFEIKTGLENTYASVLSLSTTNTTSLLGEAHFSLNELQDQYKISQWFNLYGKKGEQTNGQLCLEMQYVKDQTQYYQLTLANIDNYLIELQAEKTQFQDDIKMIYSPFSKKNLQKPQLNVLIDAPNLMFINELTRPVIYKNEKKVDLLRFKNPLLTDQEVNDLLELNGDSDYIIDANNKYPAQEDISLKVNYGLIDPTRDIYILEFLIIIFMISSLFLCFIRTDFVNVTLAILCFIIISLNYFEKQYLNIMSLLLLITTGIDLIWLVLYQYIWVKQMNASSSFLENYKYHTIQLTYAIMLIKIILSIALWRVKPIAEYLNNKNQFGLGAYLYNTEGGQVNPFIASLRD